MKLLFASVFGLLLTGFAFSANAQQSQLPPLVSTSGLGEVKVQPDQITFTTGVEIREKTLEDARRVADQRTAALLTFLKKNGVDDKHVQTAYLSLQPVYTGEFGQTTPQFYQATRSISVTLNKIDKFDELMSGLYKAGANRVDGISYQSSQLKKHQEEARKRAVQDAKQKAMALASELGAKVGRPYQINEGGSNAPGPVMYKGMMRESMVAMDGGGSTLALGEIIITSGVQVSFLLE
ncbi:SIMPL domain-containing protein [Rufibacter sediminis]|uniref:SIMPL domain-containing protein n=1 Tax=Rufibacter sediminis TaxID=2762756 RepID=A0ABR6VUE4_9BACT|nr:SIMPL domain-containing protein [Rufibacter sediminis]MBC3540519.1 SIMPL domain-containing protein [Rufibacter sediminis]